ncbi:MAG: hypothetical protein ACLSW4_03920 [Clostridia bacterium]
MLNELQNLVPSEKEQKLQVFVNQLINNLYNNKKIEVDSEKLLELLSYLTSDENISTQMKSCVEVQNRRITDILHKKEVKHLKKYIEYLKENSIPKQKVKEILDKLHISDIEPWSVYKVSGDILFNLKEMVEDK